MGLLFANHSFESQCGQDPSPDVTCLAAAWRGVSEAVPAARCPLRKHPVTEHRTTRSRGRKQEGNQVVEKEEG